MLGLSKSLLNHHQTWWPTMSKRDAIKGQSFRLLQVCMAWRNRLWAWRPLWSMEAGRKLLMSALGSKLGFRGFFLGHLGRILLGLVILDFGLGYYGHWTLILVFVFWFILFFGFCMGQGKNGPLQIEIN
ncbi:hypothetical protein ERO13_A02G064901v2 [Gossypium hirsutum]|nr:hypothetical protein ERO13_A02G064901v2 [Gossypium hirsutum]